MEKCFFCGKIGTIPKITKSAEKEYICIDCKRVIEPINISLLKMAINK